MRERVLHNNNRQLVDQGHYCFSRAGSGHTGQANEEIPKNEGISTVRQENETSGSTNDGTATRVLRPVFSKSYTYRTKHLFLWKFATTVTLARI